MMTQAGLRACQREQALLYDAVQWELTMTGRH